MESLQFPVVFCSRPIIPRSQWLLEYLVGCLLKSFYTSTFTVLIPSLWQRQTSYTEIFMYYFAIVLHASIIDTMHNHVLTVPLFHQCCKRFTYHKRPT